MVNVSFPDGVVREYPRGTTGTAIAQSISKSLAAKAVAMKLNGRLTDLAESLENDGPIEFVMRDDAAALELIRHDCAHVLAEAVQELWPETQVTIGPAIDDGFYYDFARDPHFTEQDFPLIEKKMAEIIARNAGFIRETWDREEAKRVFEAKGESYKVEIIDAIPEGEDVNIYKQGQWMDVCRGPHMRSTRDIGTAFKLTKVAGAYWRGDSKNKMLSRIYGTAWANQRQLDDYLEMIAEAEKRDHRKLGRELNLFHLQEEAQGSVFWHPSGFVIYNQIEQYIRRKITAAGYREVKTPQLMDSKFWKKSGHWSKFREDMFVVPDLEFASDAEDLEIDPGARMMALKPMNCPAHVQIFNQGIKSYRDLPLRYAEFGCCHRNELRGALHGLMRVRQMTQDDGHIFCREDQVTSETEAFCALLDSVYEDMGFAGLNIMLSTRPEQRAGSDEVWDRAESGLADALRSTGRAFVIDEGEGAFYGPKLEFHLKDAIGRTWQCGTLQLDFVLPERLDAAYIDHDGTRRRPVMLHRAILGSLERFIGILIENHAGRMPMWLAPTQAVVATIVSDVEGPAQDLANDLAAEGIRVETDFRNEKINYKVREHSHGKVPVILVIGAREANEGTVSIRRLGERGQKVVPVKEAIAMLKQDATPPDLMA